MSEVDYELEPVGQKLMEKLKSVTCTSIRPLNKQRKDSPTRMAGVMDRHGIMPLTAGSTNIG